jgi:hypothetical protein
LSVSSTFDPESWSESSDEEGSRSFYSGSKSSSEPEVPWPGPSAGPCSGARTGSSGGPSFLFLASLSPFFSVGALVFLGVLSETGSVHEGYAIGASTVVSVDLLADFVWVEVLTAPAWLLVPPVLVMLGAMMYA